MKKISFLIILGLLTGRVAKAQLVINELMQSNVDCIMDELNEFPDSWVELYNTGNTDINIKDYRVGISDKADEAWRLPDAILGPKEFALVLCDKEATIMHTHFRLESGKGCNVYLFKGSNIIDKVTDLPKQPAPNIAYGRKVDGGNEWGYQLHPTPRQANTGETTDNILGDPVFSESGRIFTQGSPLSLTLSLPEGSPQGTKILYTVDASEPTSESAIYVGPIPISATTIVRAKLFCYGWLSPRSVTHSYIFLPREQTLPVVSISTDTKYLANPQIGIYVDGSYQGGHSNYEYNWRRPMNIELFEEDGQTCSINQLCEARIMGESSRKYTPKSMIFYAHKRFGTKHFNYEFFPDQKPGLVEQKSILLRNAGGDNPYLYLRDALIQRVMGTYTDIDWQPWRPAIIYLNGTYLGIINIRERSTDDFIWANYDKLEDIDMIENWADEDDEWINQACVKAGDRENLNQFKKFYKQRGHTREEYEKWMDCVEFINLMVMNLYFGNKDFPGNNTLMWRPRVEGGLWRFVAKDTDWGLGHEQWAYPTLLPNRCPAYVNMIDYITNYHQGDYWPNKPKYTALFRYMMEDQSLNHEFVDRCSIYMGDFLNEKGVREIWDPMYEKIKTEHSYHRQLYPEERDFDLELTDARRWLSERTGYFYDHLASSYNLGNPIPMTINKSVDEASKMTVTFNRVKLSKGTFDGKFFRNHVVTLAGKAPEGKEITGWKMVTESDGGTKEDIIEGSLFWFVMPKCNSVTINAILSDINGISTLSSPNWTWQREGDRLIVSKVPVGVKVQIYDLRGMLINSVVSDGTEIIVPLSTSQLYILKIGDKTVKF